MSKIIFIVGPTASQKSDTAFSLAKQIKAEIVSADSMLVYKQPQIITAKPSYKMLNLVKHHFIGEISVEETYSVFDYYYSATSRIKELFYKKIPVVVCGGSGLYLKALLDGIFEGVGKDEGLRSKLTEAARMYGNEYIYSELKKVDSSAAKRIHPTDQKRIIRALEVYYLSGVPISEKQKYSFGLYQDFPIRIFGLRLPRAALYQRIEQRVDKMFEAGLVDEVKGLNNFKLGLTSSKIIGINEINTFLSSQISELEASQEIKKNTRRFAKRQITWFKKDKRIEWIDIDNLTPGEIKTEILRRIN